MRATDLMMKKSAAHIRELRPSGTKPPAKAGGFMLSLAYASCGSEH